jgi:MoaA/NifB/PqqE/SkfB family radical SAM enzyme
MAEETQPPQSQEWSDFYNPFNSWKLLAQIPRWQGIKNWEEGKGELPAPTTVSIDPANICNIRCLGCNAEFLMQKNHNSLSKDTLKEIADFLPTWGDEPYNVKGACWGGGGSPLLNSHTGEFIQRLKKNGVQSGIVTNGTMIHKNLEALCDCEWVGVSVDAGTHYTYRKVKGADKFYQVIGNIQALALESKKNNSTLNLPGKGHGISYKYLLRPETIDEIHYAAHLAKDIGCRNIHIRPIAPSWDKVKGATNVFNKYDIDKFRKRLSMARELENKDFNIYGITHKFNGDFTPSYGPDKCYAIYMSAVIMPPTDKRKGKFDLTTCCDNRGNDLLTQRNLTSVEQIRDYWGSQKHKELIDKINTKKCCRCTFLPHRKIYENTIQVNNMTPNFI